MKLIRRQLAVELLENRCVPAGFIAVGSDAGAIATVRIFADRDDNNTYETLAAQGRPSAAPPAAPASPWATSMATAATSWSSPPIPASPW